MDNKRPLKEPWPGSHDPFFILMPAILSPEQQKQESPYFMCRWNISNASLGMTATP